MPLKNAIQIHLNCMIMTKFCIGSHQDTLKYLFRWALFLINMGFLKKAHQQNAIKAQKFLQICASKFELIELEVSLL